MGEKFSKLSFYAISTCAERDVEVADCGFTGDHGKEFGIMSEDGSLARISWHDGSRGEDEGIIGIASVVLGPGRLSIVFDRAISGWSSTIPYSGVDITYDDLDDRSLDLIDVFEHILSSMPDRIQIET